MKKKYKIDVWIEIEGRTEGAMKITYEHILDMMRDMVEDGCGQKWIG